VAHEIGAEAWDGENIPNEAYLYMRVHKMKIDSDGEPIPGAFKNLPTSDDGMSTDWEKYSTPEETCQRGRVPLDNIVIRFLTGRVRNIPEQIVKHTPDKENNNRAHTDVFGKKTTQAREMFMSIYEKVSIEVNQS